MKVLKLSALLLGAALFTGLGTTTLSAEMKCGGGGKCGAGMMKASKDCGDKKCGTKEDCKCGTKEECKCDNKKGNMKCGDGDMKRGMGKCGGEKAPKKSMKCGTGKCG